MADRINVAELFATMGLDADQFRGAVRQVRQDAETEFARASQAAQTHADKIRSALASATAAGGGRLGQSEAATFALNSLSKAANAAGVDINKVFQLLESESGRVAVGLQESTYSATKLGGALRALGVNDIEDRFTKLTGAFNETVKAFDNGAIGTKTFTEAQRSYAAATRELDAYLNGTTVPTQDKIQKAYKFTASSVRQLGEDISFTGLRMTALVSGPITAFGVSALKMAGDVERAEASMLRMTGSAQVTGQIMKELRQITLTTPMEFQGALEGTRRLISMGFAAEKATPILRVLGDTVAGVGGDQGTMSRLIKALGDIQAKGFLAGEELRQLSNIPVPAIAIISEQLGQSTGKTLDDIKTKSITASNAINLLLRGLTQRFGGEMQTQANTLNVLWKNVQEQAQFALRDIGKALLPLGKQVAEFASDAISATSTMAESFGKLPSAIQGTVVAMGAFLAVGGPTLIVVGQLVAAAGHLAGAAKLLSSPGAIAGITTALLALKPVIIAVAAVFATWKLVTLAHDVKDFINETDAAANRIPRSFDAVTESIKEVKKETSSLAKIWDAFKGGLSAGLTPGTAANVLGEGSGLQAFFGGGLTTKSTFNRGFTQDMAKLGRPGLFGASPVRAFDPLTGRPTLTTSAKQDIDKASKEYLEGLDRAKEDAEKKTNELRQARAKAFGEIGVKDIRTDIDDLQSSLIKLRGVLSNAQKTDANNNLVNLIVEGSKEGVVKVGELNRVMKQVGEGNFFRFAMFGKDPDKMISDLNATVNSLDSLSETANSAYKNFVFAGDGFKNFNVIAYEGGQALASYSDALDRMNGSLKNLRQVPKAALGIQGEDTLRIGAARSVLGISDRGADIATMRQAAETLQKYANVDSNFRSTAAKGWKAYYQARLEDGGKLTRQEQEHYDQINRQLGAARRLENMWRGIRTQVSTIITDFSRSAIEILIPRNTDRQDPFSGDVMSGFQKAYQQLSAQGYSNPKAALQSTITAIRNATTLADANRIAIKAFGDIGPTIAKGIREGTIAGDKLVQTLDKISNNIEVVNNKGSKMKQLFDEVKRSILRAFAEEVAQAVADFASKHLKKVIDMLGDMLTKLPIIGKALEKIFGIGGKGGVLNGPTIPGVPGNGPAIPAPPISFPGPPSGTSSPRLPGGGSVGSGGSGALASISQITGIVTGAISAATGVLSYLQGRRMEQDIGRMEVTSRQTFAELTNFRADAWVRETNLMKKLDDIWNTIMVKFDENTQATREFAGVGVGGGGTINIYLNDAAVSGPAAAVKMLTDAVTMIRRQGYTGKGVI